MYRDTETVYKYVQLIGSICVRNLYIVTCLCSEQDKWNKSIPIRINRLASYYRFVGLLCRFDRTEQFFIYILGLH